MNQRNQRATTPASAARPAGRWAFHLILRLALAAGATAIASVVAPADAGAQTRAELERAVQKRVLRNGLEVVVIENHGVPLATVEINVRNGSFTQTPDYAGLAHLYEHMFFKANARYPEPEAFIDRAAELGAQFNGTTQEERVNYYMHVVADSVGGAMELLAASLREPIFRPGDLAREKEVVLGEYDRQESSPFFALTQRMGAKLYPGQWSRKNTIGDRDVIRRATVDQLRTIQRKYYVPNNSVLIVAGDVKPAQIFALAERHFGDWARGEDPFAADPIPPIPPLERNEALIVEQPVNAVSVVIEWQGPSVGKDPGATYAADVFSDALNDPSSAFRRRLVDSGLWDDIGVNYYTLNHTGPISISGQTSPGKLRAALAALEQEIAKFGNAGYVTPAELAQVKAQRAVSSAMGFERASGLAHTVGFWWSVASLDYFLGYVDAMARQTPADLKRYVTTYIIGKPRVVGVLLSPEDRAKLNLTEQELAGTWRVQP